MLIEKKVQINLKETDNKLKLRLKQKFILLVSLAMSAPTNVPKVVKPILKNSQKKEYLDN